MINYYYSRGSRNGRKLPIGNPLANALVILVGTLAVAATVVLGFLAFIAVASLILILAAIIGIRVWWLNRRLARQRRSRGSGSRPHGAEDRDRIHVIEGEFSDLSRGSSERDPRP